MQCETTCDRWGYHLQQCPSSGGHFVGHDTKCAEVADLMGGLRVSLEQLLIGIPWWLHGLAPQEATKQTSASSTFPESATSTSTAFFH